MPPSIEEAARTLGAGPWRTFLRVTLPLIRSGVITGALLAFIMSFDNVNISLLLKSVGTTTLPIQLFDYLRYDFDPTAAAASTVSVALTMSLLVVIDRIYGLRAVRF
jgi:putative spermidine/putrescine transport system permease protein